MATVLKKDVVNYYDPQTGDRMQRQEVVEVQEHKAVDEIVKTGAGKSVVLQIGPTPGEVYAVFAKNKPFHEDTPDAWMAAARTALEVWAGRGNRTVTSLMNEHGRPMNLKLEYTV